MKIKLSTLRQIIREELGRMGTQVPPENAPPWEDEDIEQYGSSGDDDGFGLDPLDDEPTDAQLSAWEDAEADNENFHLERMYGKY
jgi:hypothetical protein